MANSVDPDRTLRSAMSDLDLHCFLQTCLYTYSGAFGMLTQFYRKTSMRPNKNNICVYGIPTLPNFPDETEQLFFNVFSKKKKKKKEVLLG